MESSLNALVGKEWKDIKKIVLFGYGRQGKKAFKTLSKEFEIVAIIENDRTKVGLEEKNVNIIHFSEAIDYLKKYKVIVTTSEHYYKEICTQLQQLGLCEYKDYIMFQQFIVEWYYKYRKKIYIPKTDLSVTSYCSLNCEKCQLFMPYWKKKEHFDLDMLRTSIDNYFSCVDYVLDFDILGGEPLVYPYLEDLLEYLGENYREKIGYFGIITNGTIIPSKAILNLLKEYDIGVSISDYSEQVNYKNRINALCKKLDAYSINYMQNTNIEWYDFGFPEHPYCYGEDKIKEHMQCCNTICHLLHDNKFYYCGIAWAAHESGLYKEKQDGYIDLKRLSGCSIEEKKELLECSLGNIKEDYLKFCKYCGGFGIDNINKIDTARQKYDINHTSYKNT